ncbi:hypothetical protein AB0P17_27940 [Streptomyces sp. NPDC088124]|uniref:hypothetical protein n=1 Tax=Streptomyces sp. NPDC088124 TaxID=3154654 RepID=UPI003436BE81
MEDARRWLAEQSITEAAGRWFDAEAPDRPLTGNEVALAWAGQLLTDESLEAAERVRLAFGLLDLLGEYWVSHEIRSADQGPEGPLPADALWDGYRRGLEADRDAEAVTYSLWVDWFEDPDTAATAFAEVLGNDIDRVVAQGAAGPAAPLRRAGRALAVSGPVPWPVKRAAYDAAARLPALHGPLFKGLLAGYHDVRGDLDPAPARSLLARLRLPADTPHLAELRAVLAAGHRNHYRSPHAWNDAVRATAD